MNINCKLFRLSTYQPHKVTGEEPRREVSFTSYRSGDNGGKQMNYSLKIGLTVWHLKLRGRSGRWRENPATADLLKATDDWCGRQDG